MNPSTRHISNRTLALIRAMATDSASSPALQAFHAARLRDLETIRARQSQVTDDPKPFTRFLAGLESEN